MAHALSRADACGHERSTSSGCGNAGRLGAVALATLAIGLAACGDDGDDETTAPGAANETARSGAPTSTGSSCATGEEPGFRPGAAPGAMPPSGADHHGRQGVREGDAPGRRPTRGDCAARGSSRSPPSRSAAPRTAGITNVALFATAEGAERSLAHELRTDVIRAVGPVANLRRFTVPGIPGARGWTASEPHVGNVLWVQGRCMHVLGNQGPGPFVGPLSTGARAIYERTGGHCP